MIASQISAQLHKLTSVRDQRSVTRLAAGKQMRNLLHVRTISKVISAHLVTAATGELKRDRSDRMNVRTFNDGNHTTFTTVSFFIGQSTV